MLAAVICGDVGKLSELIKQDPGFDVNIRLDVDGRTLLHCACFADDRSAAIPLLLAHPDIDVNLKNQRGETPFYLAFQYGSTSCVREMLKDSRVNVNEMDTPNSFGLPTMATLTSPSGGSRLGGRWISGNQGMARRIPFWGQRREERQTW